MNSESIKVIFGGDLMLGRLVAAAMRDHGSDYPLGPVAALFGRADLAIANLECTLTGAHTHWPGAPKEFYFRAPRAAAVALAHAGIDCVNLANNHSMDFGAAGLADTIHELDQRRIAHFGAGADRAGAERPAILSAKGVTLALAGYCDHQADFAAGVGKPGIAYLDLNDEDGARLALADALAAMRERKVDWPILSLHWGPNLVDHPSAHLRRIGHAAIEMGWRIVYGHSAHVFQGVECHGNGVILYGTGELVDDYFVDPDYRNDRALAFELTLAGARIERIELHPLLIAGYQVQPAATIAQAEHDAIVNRAAHLSSALGTAVHREAGRAWIDGPAG